ncbi:MAG: hypothetical protein IPK85_12545 [Gemmatimonadetes bacterium]|nr:hypothetical protein [Gemmatimonadota bacterium]
MRIARQLGLSLVVLALPAVTIAQTTPSRTSFENSWYWGAKGGVSSFDPNGAGRVTASSIGAEWLITRSRGALYLSVDQSFFDDVAGVYDPTVQGSVRPVDVSDWRRYGIGLLAFPVTWGNMKPYAGLGLSINVIQNANPQGTFTTTASQTSVFDDVAEQTSKVSATMTAGLQIQLGRAALFGQASAMPTRNNFLISGSSHTFVLEGGLRFNLASAIDVLR